METNVLEESFAMRLTINIRMDLVQAIEEEYAEKELSAVGVKFGLMGSERSTAVL